jgi:DNA-directed RNA polymerase subunit RPC12/RpoP
MSNIKKEKHFLDGLIDTYHSSIDIKQELQVQPSPDAYKGHFINALTLASTHFMDMQPIPNARELWPQSQSSAQQQSGNSQPKPESQSDSDLAEKKYICPECNRSFQRKDKLTRHVQCVHEKLKPHACTLCEQIFSRKDKLKRHFSSIHMKEKPFLCNHCSFATNRKDRIKTHVMSVHSQHPEDFTHQPGNSVLTSTSGALNLTPEAEDFTHQPGNSVLNSTPGALNLTPGAETVVLQN